MANEFPGALGNAAGNGVEESLIQHSGDDDPQCAVRSCEALLANRFAKCVCESAQDPDFNRACPKAGTTQKMTGAQRQTRPEWIAERTNPASRRRAQQRTQNPGK